MLFPRRYIRRALITAFSGRDDVESIWLNKERCGLVAYIITNHETYQDKATEEMINAEYDIRSQQTGLQWEVKYLPKQGDELMIPYTSKCIWQHN